MIKYLEKTNWKSQLLRANKRIGPRCRRETAQKVLDDGKKVFCTTFNQELLAVSLQKFQNHVVSKSHQKNLNDDEGKDNKSKKFLIKWLQGVRFDSWLQTVFEDETRFHFTL